MKLVARATAQTTRTTKKGFTLIELLISIFLLVVLFSLGTITYLKIQRSTDLSSELSKLKATLRQAQSQSQSGFENNSFAVHLEKNRYTLFKGSSFNPADSTNIEVLLPDYLDLSLSNTTLPSDLIFEQNTGEILNFNASNNTIIISDTRNNESGQLRINRLGVIDE